MPAGARAAAAARHAVVQSQRCSWRQQGPFDRSAGELLRQRRASSGGKAAAGALYGGKQLYGRHVAAQHPICWARQLSSTDRMAAGAAASICRTGLVGGAGSGQLCGSFASPPGADVQP